MMRARLTRLALAAGLLFAAPAAMADPISVLVALAPYIGTAAAAFVGTVVSYVTSYGIYALAAYSTISARSKARRAAAAARASYNAGLVDRNVTALSADPEWRYIYGRADTGGDVVAIFTSDKPRPGGGVKPDGYKHLVVVWSARQCQAINDVKIEGISLGGLDGAGWAQGAEWKQADAAPVKESLIAGNVHSTSLPSGSAVVGVSLLTGGESAQMTLVPAGGAQGWSITGTAVTLPATVSLAGFDYTPQNSDQWIISYTSPTSTPSTVRVLHHLGAPDQAADATLMALVPGQWTANHRLRGRCYSVITLDLERSQFQGGPPGITADISGALVLDPRTGTTAWSDNTALCAYDYLRDVAGYAVTTAEVDEASVIAAANACDVTTSFTIGATTVTGPRYTCNGVFKATSAREAVLLDICEAMSGWASYGGNWRILAGSWTPSIMDLSDADLHGSIEIVQAGEPSGELFNAVRGQYVPAGSGVAADVEPYKNATFVAADGKPLWKDIELPFTNSKARAKNLCRIQVEQSRNGLVIFFPAKLRAWPLQTGDRVRVTSAEYGFTLKTFRVTDWQFGLRSPVGLTLQEDAADAYDEADAATADPTPNTDLPNPWVVPALDSITAASGTAQLQKLGDGTIISRVKVSWPRSTAAYMQDGRIEIAWRETGSATTTLTYAAGDDTEVYLTGVRDGAVLLIGATAINSQRARSAPVWCIHRVLGKSQSPATITGFALSLIPGAIKGTCSRTVELDYGYTIYRYGVSFSAGVKVPGTSDANGFIWPWPALGSYTVWAADVDTSGNLGTPVSQTITVDNTIKIGAGNSLASGGGAALNANPACDDASAWDVTGDAVILYTAAAGAVGTSYWSSTASANTFVTARETIPLDPARRYNFSAMLGAAPGNDRDQYLVVRMFRANGVELNGTDTGWGGSYAGYTFGGVVTSDGAWRRYGADFGAGVAGRPIPADVSYCKVFVWFQYSGYGSSAVQQAAQDVRLVDVTDARTAAAAAAAAQGTADAAAGNATTALGTLATMRSNGYLDASEKPAVIKQYQAIYDEQAGIAAQASAYGVTTERTAYISAFNALVSYLSSLSPAWNDTTSDTLITPAVDQATWAAYYSARQALLNKIAEVAGTLAVWNSISGTGKPLDNAGKTVDLGGATGVFGARDRDDLPSEYPWGRSLQFKQASSIGLSGSDGTYCTLETLIQFVDDSGGPNVQYAYQGSKTWRRTALRTAGAWGSWTQDLDRNSYTGDLAATRNTVFYQDTDPGSVPDGSIWISSTKAYQRVSGAWQPYVGNGSVDTTQLASAAATDVTTVTFTAISFNNIA